MRILEKAEGAFGACVLYENDGATFQVCGSSIREIEQGLRRELNERPVLAADEKPAEPEPEPAQAEEQEEDPNPEGNNHDTERKGETDL